MESNKFTTVKLKEICDYLAPDSSEIRLLPNLKGGGLCHCTLPVGGVSKAVRHKTVDEVWFFLSGEGIVWRKYGTIEEQTNVSTGVSLVIAQGTHFQFRNTGKEPLKFIILSSPCWTGASEAVLVDNFW